MEEKEVRKEEKEVVEEEEKVKQDEMQSSDETNPEVSDQKKSEEEVSLVYSNLSSLSLT